MKTRSLAGPLRVHPRNPRYFTDDRGRAILLCGSHTWTVLQDAGRSWPPRRFDYEGWLDQLERLGHRFFRMWAWEQARWVAHDTTDFWFDPLPYERTGPGDALDGFARYDLTRLNPRYFERLRERVAAAGERGIYPAVMLFQGWSIEPKVWYLSAGLNPWLSHPFNRANNVNGIDGDPNGEDHGRLTHTLLLPDILEVQRSYIRAVVEAVVDLDNALFEVGNEDVASPETDAWQDWVVRTLREEEQRLGARHHPALRTVQWPTPPSLDALFASPAEAISPNSPAAQGIGLEDYCLDPPPADGRKVIIADTDHLWGIGGDWTWVWRSVMRGLNAIYMDPWEDDFVLTDPYDYRARLAMGTAVTLADRYDFAGLLPDSTAASSRFALATPDRSLVLALTLPSDRFSIDLRDRPGMYDVEWMHPLTGLGRPDLPVEGGRLVPFRPPFRDGAIAIVSRRPA